MDICHVKKIVWFFLFNILYFISFAQNSHSRNKDMQGLVSDEIRKQSSLFANGLRAFYSQDYNTSEQHFRSVIAQNPKNNAAYFMLSKIRSASNDFAGAAYYIGEAVKLDKQNIWYVLEMANIYDHLGDYKLSAKYWEEVCKQKKDNEYYLLSLANAYLQLQHYQKVIEVYNRLEEMIGVNDEILNIKKNIFLLLNDVKSAVAEYDQLIEKYPNEIKYYIGAAKIYSSNNNPDKAYSYLQKAMKIDKKNPWVALALADYYTGKSQEDKCYESLIIALKYPELPMEEIDTYLSSYYQEAVTSKDEKKLKKTIHLFEAALEGHPRETSLWSNYARLIRNNHPSQEMRIALEKALSLNHDDFSIWESYLKLLLDTKDYQTIINNEEELTELFPFNAFILYDIGTAYYELKKTEEAINLLNQASQYSQGSVLLSDIYHRLGDCYKSQSNTSEALHFYKMAQLKGDRSSLLKEKIENLETH
jgi:tetratricopeptide (TPR) repeat protein